MSADLQKTYLVKRQALTKIPGIRTRLFTSYLLLLAISLVVLTVALLLLLGSRQAPPQLTWQRLEAILPGLSNQSQVRPLLGASGRDVTLIDQFATTNDVRVLMLRIDGDDALVVYDSADAFDPRDTINMQRAPYNSRLRPVNRNTDIVFGRFENVDAREWLFAGIFYELDRPRLPADRIALMIAEERPSESLQSVLVEFGSSFLIPLVQAGLVGLVVAFVLAFFISRSIARQLDMLGKAASSVAEGHYNEQVPETGLREVRAVAIAFNRMSAQVRASQTAQNDFVANVSHDLKTPLTSIRGFSQAIIDGAAKNPVNAAQIIHDEADRLTRMVSELTDLARLQAGRLSMKSTAIDVGKMVAGIGQRLSVVAAEKSITLDVQAEPLPPIAGDGDRLVQVFTNLIGNAIKYTPDGGQIWVSTDMHQRGVRVVIRDTGMGIPPADLPRLFERFYQVDKARGPERGTGLGLAITREIIEAHGGTIHITSPGKDQGTTVTVWLPSPDLTTIVQRRR